MHTFNNSLGEPPDPRRAIWANTTSPVAPPPPSLVNPGSVTPSLLYLFNYNTMVQL